MHAFLQGFNELYDRSHVGKVLHFLVQIWKDFDFSKRLDQTQFLIFKNGMRIIIVLKEIYMGMRLYRYQGFRNGNILPILLCIFQRNCLPKKIKITQILKYVLMNTQNFKRLDLIIIIF